MRKLHDQIVHRDDSLYSTFPSLTRAFDGTLLCGFRQAPQEPEGYSHLHSRSRAMAVLSHDDGETWESSPFMLCPDDELGQQDPQLMTTSRGRIIASFFRWQAHALTEEVSANGPDTHTSKGCLWTNTGIGYTYSDDHGKTWAPLKRVAYPFLERGGASRAPIIELPSGRLLLTCYGAVTHNENCVSYQMASDDHGESWHYHATIHDGRTDGRQSHEPYTVRLNDGRLACFIRSYGDDGLMLLTTSDDDGKTWATPVETTVWGYPQAGLVLPDGRVVLACGYRRDPLGVRARILAPDLSDVDTAHELIIRDDGVTTDLGYPTLALRRDGSVLCAYYIHGEDGIRHIAASILQP